MSQRTHDQKADFCRRFLASGESQESFCERHRENEGGGPSARSLREWLRIYTDPGVFTAEARAIVAHAAGELGALLRAFDALDGVRHHAGHVATTDHARPATVDVPPESEAAYCQNGSDSEPAEVNRSASGEEREHEPRLLPDDGRHLAGAGSEAEHREGLKTNDSASGSFLDEGAAAVQQVARGTSLGGDGEVATPLAGQQPDALRPLPSTEAPAHAAIVAHAPTDASSSVAVENSLPVERTRKKSFFNFNDE